MNSFCGQRGGRNKTVPKRYLPKQLTHKDKITQKRGLIRSQKLYKKGKYLTS